MCSIDGKAYRGLQIAQADAGQARGRHSFAVYSVDAAGNVDPSPDVYSWKVKAKDD